MVRLPLLLGPFFPFSDAIGLCLGSPWGAGAFAGADGSRQPSALELEVAKIQGTAFYELVTRNSVQVHPMPAARRKFGSRIMDRWRSMGKRGVLA